MVAVDGLEMKKTTFSLLANVIERAKGRRSETSTKHKLFTRVHHYQCSKGV